MDEEYEMPEDYKRGLEKYSEMLNDREKYARIIPTLPADLRREAAPLLKKLDGSLDAAEQKLAEQYDDHQARERDIDEKREAVWEGMERIFIIAKHRFPKDEFEAYEKKTTGKMDAGFKREFYERIAIRESFDLHNILAALRPKDGSRYTPPMQLPMRQLKEATYEINLLIYEIPEDFREIQAEFEESLAIRRAAANRIKYAAPARRGKMRSDLAKLDAMLESAKVKLMEFLEICLNESGRVEVEVSDRKKVDAAFERAEIASDRNFILTKHTRPELIEGLTEINLSIYDTPEEIAGFYARIAKREAEELDEILRSVDGN